jgi:MULE transposase domain/SWIM zinc finger
VFWAFGPSIHAFGRCRPVISVDGTHLKGAYKGKLLVACCKTSDNNILPVAFALVPKETYTSWKWFIECLRRHVLGGRPTCIVSDRDPGCIKAMSVLLNRYPDLGVHRFCLEHVKANLCNHHRMKGLKGACQILGTVLQEQKYNEQWERIEALCPGGANYLRGIEPHMWTLYADGGWRWGMTTTNISESFNNVLRGGRHLPIRALVECSLAKSVQIFRDNILKIHQCETPLAPDGMKRLEKNRRDSVGHIVELWAEQNACYHVHTTGYNVHEVKYFEQMCSCGKWKMERIPCSHAIAVALQRNEPDLVSLVHPFYTRSVWADQFSKPFSPILGSHTWPNVDWKLRPDMTRLILYGGPGRRRQRRLRGEMDHMRGEGRGTNRCTRCGRTSHNANRCPLTHPPRDTM